MAKFQSEVLQGKSFVPTAGAAGVVVAQEVVFVAPKGGLQANDIIEMAVLPFDARIVDATVNLSTVGNVKVGLMNNAGSAIGADEFIAGAIAADATSLRMSKGYGLTRSEQDRVVAVSSSAAITQGTKVYLQIQYVQ